MYRKREVSEAETQGLFTPKWRGKQAAPLSQLLTLEDEVPFHAVSYEPRGVAGQGRGNCPS